ncbi:MAG: T9SS type A sorting domain-containing protein [Candidatus Marinimicrobia bacterium]|nr:T9SS type A sorting domain-containing protein [Candidatus Neomarinimicrobiota bacterium]
MEKVNIRIRQASIVILITSMCISTITLAANVQNRDQHPPQIMHQRSTTGPIPPASVRPKTQDIRLRDMFLEVPGYSWRHGCGPTALGMIIGFYDTNGFDELIPGDATSQTLFVNQVIASEGDSNDPQHYEDYSQPIDDIYSGILADKSEIPEGDEHASNSIADFMRTSFSVDGSYYGSSNSAYIEQAFTDYVNYTNPELVVSTDFYSSITSPLTWEILIDEINSSRPMVFIVDTDGDGGTDHYVAVVGYRESPSPQYGCLDTWAPVEVVRWCDFEAISEGQEWGIWGGWSFEIQHPPVQISGFVRNEFSNEGIENIPLVISSLDVTIYSASNGFYSISVPFHWTGSITPISESWDFNPQNRTYNQIEASLVQQNFNGASTHWIYYNYQNSGFHIIHKIKPDGSQWENIKQDADLLDVSIDDEFMLYKSILYPPYGNYELVRKSLISDNEETLPYLANMNRTNWAIFTNDIDIIFASISTNAGAELYKYNIVGQQWIDVASDPINIKPYFSPDRSSFIYYEQAGNGQYSNLIHVAAGTGETMVIANNAMALTGSTAWGSSNSVYYEGLYSVTSEYPGIWKVSLLTLEKEQCFTQLEPTFAPHALKNDPHKILFSSLDTTDLINDNFNTKMYLYDEITGEISLLHQWPNNCYIASVSSASEEDRCVIHLEADDAGEGFGLYTYDIGNNLCSFLFDGRNPVWSGSSIDPSTLETISKPLLPKDYSLRQNYPNPFNPTTTISYDLPVQTMVTLTVYDIKGRTITTLTDSHQLPGAYSIQWGGTDDSGIPMSTGLYLCRLQAGDHNKTIKMLLLK